MEFVIKYYPYTLAAMTLLWMVGLWACQKSQEIAHSINTGGVPAGADLSGGKRAVPTLHE